MKKKHHHFTAQHEDTREQGAAEESGDSGMILPITVERWEKGREGASGAGDSTRTLPMMLLETQDKGLNKSRRSYSGKKEMGGGKSGKRGRGGERQRVKDAGYSRVLTLHLKDLVAQVGLDVVLTICGQYQP